MKQFPFRMSRISEITQEAITKYVPEDLQQAALRSWVYAIHKALTGPHKQIPVTYTDERGQEQSVMYQTGSVEDSMRTAHAMIRSYVPESLQEKAIGDWDSAFGRVLDESGQGIDTDEQAAARRMVEGMFGNTEQE